MSATERYPVWIMVSMTDELPGTELGGLNRDEVELLMHEEVSRG